jgi:response regulator of citrate/malate metabolism
MITSPPDENNKGTMKLLVLDHSALICKSLVALLQAFSGMREIVKADTLKQAIGCIELERPAMIIPDLHFHDGSAVQPPPPEATLAKHF